VHFTRDLFAPENTLLQKIMGGDGVPPKVLAVVDRGVHLHHPHLLDRIGSYFQPHRSPVALLRPPLVFPGGEKVKNNPEYVDLLQKAIHDSGLCRHSYVLAIGGGALIDMAGFAAATAHRGVRLIRIPTTVLAQADASIGVKNSINAFGKKNFIGTFAPPWAVLNDFAFLTTLSRRDWIAGVAEAIKVALIQDAPFLAFIEAQAGALSRRDPAAMEQVIHRSARLHLNHIATSGDPFEAGSSRPLDFGHWSAHKLEQLTHHRLRHGEAVAIGLALDATYSWLAGLLPEKHWQRLLTTLTNLGFCLFAPELEDSGPLLDGLNEFREHLGGRLTVMLLKRIGQGLEVHEMDPELVLAAVQILKNIASSHFRASPPSRRAAAGYGELRVGGGPGT
jgi:3-dehydroquinate synthase